MGRKKGHLCKQFPLIASSAKTIHKAQGQTKAKVVVDMTTGSRPHRHYVAFSRVTSLQGLYLLNGLNGKIKVDQSVVSEMHRLRTQATCSLSFKTTNSLNGQLVLVFQNAQSLNKHFDLIKNDSTFIDADIVCFAETRLCSRDQDEEFSLRGFHSVYRNDQQTIHMKRPEHGLAIYVKTEFEVILSANKSTKSIESQIINVRKMRTNEIYTVLVVYKAPTCTVADFKSHIMSISRNDIFSKKLIIVGDFNIDICEEQNINCIEFMCQSFPCAHLLKTLPTTHGETTLDLAFTTCSNAKADITSCIWSYHHTLIVSVD